METENKRQYGMFGWKEFHRNRQDILDEFDRARDYNRSRPMQTEHGNAGEADIRRWLGSFLPAKFGVTSGYIIPDVVVGSYVLRHYDVIIYDALSSPILWVDGNRDDSEQGRKRAIPAKHVRSVLEVKASLTADSANAAIEKLGEINEFAAYMPKSFTCAPIFMELNSRLVDNGNILAHLIPEKAVVGYWGGVVLRCEVETDTTGLFWISEYKGVAPANVVSTPLARKLDSLDIQLNPERTSLSIGTGGAGVALIRDQGRLHCAKTYGPTVFDKQHQLTLKWSRNNFAQFALDLLSMLDGEQPGQNRRYVFGQVFDYI